MSVDNSEARSMINGKKRAYVPKKYAETAALGLADTWANGKEGFRDEPCKVYTVKAAQTMLAKIPGLKDARITKKNKDNNAGKRIGDFLLEVAKRSESQGFVSMSDLKAAAEITANVTPEVGSKVFRGIVNKLVAGGYIGYARGQKGSDDEAAEVDLDGFSLEIDDDSLELDDQA